MKTIHKIALFVGLAAVISISSCKREDELTGNGDLTLEFENVAGDLPLVLGNTYVNANGDSVTITKFNYYVSNFSLVKSDGTVYTIPKDSSYFLLKEVLNSPNQEITLKNIPAGDYKTVNFIIGVDSLKSTAPVSERTGVLDPAGEGAGMYWMWNSGYIFVKVEGTSPQAPLDSAAGTRDFAYHIGLFGGYSSPTLNNIKKVSLSEAGGEMAEVRKDVTPQIHIKADVLELFKSPTTVSVAANPMVMVSPYSATIANNYADMFAIEHIHN